MVKPLPMPEAITPEQHPITKMWGVGYFLPEGLQGRPQAMNVRSDGWVWLIDPYYEKDAIMRLFTGMIIVYAQAEHPKFIEILENITEEAGRGW